MDDDVYYTKLVWIERELTELAKEMRENRDEPVSMYANDIRNLSLRIREVLDN